MRSLSAVAEVLCVELQPFDPGRDLALVESWLHSGHVGRWWGQPAAVVPEISSRDERSAALIHLNGNPVGLLCWQPLSPRELLEAGLADLPDGLIDVDIMIGDPNALGRGVGPEALRLLFEKLRLRGVEHIGMATSIANTRAHVAYAKAGLRPFRDFVEDGEQYHYLIKTFGAAA